MLISEIVHDQQLCEFELDKRALGQPCMSLIIYFVLQKHQHRHFPFIICVLQRRANNWNSTSGHSSQDLLLACKYLVQTYLSHHHHPPLAVAAMSRLYITASMPHKNWTGLAVPTLSIETNDHTGGGINYGGLHPSSIAALLGKGPDVKKGERFDLKFNVNVSIPPEKAAHPGVGGVIQN